MFLFDDLTGRPSVQGGYPASPDHEPCFGSSIIFFRPVCGVEEPNLQCSFELRELSRGSLNVLKRHEKRTKTLTTSLLVGEVNG
jgi:hypothetical protein